MGSVPKPRPGVKYTAQQVELMRQAWPDFVMPGHVMRIENGLTSFVPDHKAVAPWSGEGRALNTYYTSEQTVDEMFPTEPIKKRTPQQRLDSLTERIAQTGLVGLSEEKIQDLVGRSWKRGQPLTADQVRDAAASLLRDAENRFETSERRKIVRTSPND